MGFQGSGRVSAEVCRDLSKIHEFTTVAIDHRTKGLKDYVEADGGLKPAYANCTSCCVMQLMRDLCRACRSCLSLRSGWPTAYSTPSQTSAPMPSVTCLCVGACLGGIFGTQVCSCIQTPWHVAHDHNNDGTMPTGGDQG